MSLLEDFAADCRTRGMTELSIVTYLRTVRRFKAFLEAKGQDVLLADRLTIRDYIDERRKGGNTTKTIGTQLAAISALYEWLIFEGLTDKNPVAAVRRRYMQRYKSDGEAHTHKIISIEEAASLVEALVDIRDKTMVLLLFKTGIRRGELVSLDVDSISWEDQSILLKNTRKRSNRLVFFDDEAAHYLRRWLAVREGRDGNQEKALFLSTHGSRLGRVGLSYAIHAAAIRTGLHDASSDRMEDHFSPHCCRHWFTTHLRRAGMPREFIQELRGDARREAIDIYDHIDKEELRKSYLAHIPQLGV